MKIISKGENIMKKCFILTILLVCVVLSISLVSCSGDEDDQPETLDNVNTQDPNVQTGPVIDENAVKSAAAQIFNGYASNPEKMLFDFQTMKKNWKIENIYTDANGMIGFEEPNIDKIFVTDNMTHTVYKTEDTYIGDYVPTDEYSFVGNYGSFSIQYDGFTYRYNFDPAEESNNENDIVAFPMILPENMWYNPNESCFMIDSTVLVDVLRYYIDSQKAENSLFDLSSLESMLDTLYIDCYFNLNENMTAFSFFKVLATNYPEEGLRSEIFSIQYKFESGNTALKFEINQGFNATIGFTLDKTSETTYDMNASVLLKNSAGVIEPITFSISADVTVANEPYIQIVGFLRDKVEIAENLIKNKAKIDAIYAGKYSLNNGIECETVYVYDDKIKAFVIFEITDEQMYSYTGFNPYYDNTIGCLGVVDMNTHSLTITTHTDEETLSAALIEKYGGEYTASVDCNSLYIYDTDYEIYVIFERAFGEEYYVYDGFSDVDIYGNCCQSMIDLDNGTIEVVSHSSIEKTVESIKDIIFEVYNLEKGTCAQIVVYDNASGYYLLFGIDGSRARYAGYSSYEFVNACQGSLNIGSQSITIDYHMHSSN